MQEQNFKNHPRFVPGFHYVTSLLILGALGIALYFLFHDGFSLTTLFYLLVIGALVLIFWYSRDFAKGAQDRVIRLEENLRSQKLTGKVSDPRLTKSQVIALRFASDEEYPALAQEAIDKNLSAKDIKQAIANWKADHHRI